MPHVVKQLARGATAVLNAYTGPAGELLMDTTTKELVLHDGTTQGGIRVSGGGGATYTATAPIDITGTVISISAASTSASGAVQLSNSTSGTSQTTAATEKAVADALQAAKDYADTHGGTTYSGTAPISVSGSTISVSNATTSAKGVVQVGSNISVSSGTISVATGSSSTLGVLKVGTNISVSSGTISVASGSTSAAGIVQLNNSTSSTSQTQAATPKAVSDCLTAAKAYADTLTKTVTSTWKSGGEWYRVWSDGFIEQGGDVAYSTSATSHTLNKAFSNNNYTLIVSAGKTRGTDATTFFYAVGTPVSSTAFSYRAYNASTGCRLYWYACGY